MSNISFTTENGILNIALKDRIDSVNAADTEREINEARAASDAENVVLDCDALEYISSTGLRVILRLKKAVPGLKLINVSPEVYGIFDTTGFTKLIDIQKAYRVISVDGCEVVGRGAKGKVYRIDRDIIVKVFLPEISIEEIDQERELARTAFILGIPTAIPYDVVRIKEGGFGSVFELLDAESFAQLLISGEKTVGEIASMKADLLKIIHSTEAEPGSIPDMRDVAKSWAGPIKELLTPQENEKLSAMIEAMPEDRHMIHGDFHIKNIMLQDDEALLIDMDSVACGHPVFELAGMFNTDRAFRELEKTDFSDFLGIPNEDAARLWNETLRLYLGSSDEEYVKSVEEKAMLLGYARLLRRELRIGAPNTESGRLEMEGIRGKLKALLARTDSLTF